jgi:hypothetical protein
MRTQSTVWNHVGFRQPRVATFRDRAIWIWNHFPNLFDSTENHRGGNQSSERTTMQPSTIIASAATSASNPPAGRREIWPAAVITFGLSLTAAWVILLGYGLVRLVELAI